ncbi:MAG: Asp-tRNA(Asn)/Glu-tRNA(Gln) amidotransferase subunit GatC [Leptospiraceae bacterium]|nr:Asp-tRNA(Asn)/Glu-tRNA(Gln) amidotransferase subunit GatC [Leptospiraceae bacterium]MCP5502729.1 Asp-tRNA(Asn)/Glu-tRNA(Gln) amidotransferase subunit GatC [Leptospiraceae bacterium]
MDKQHFIEIAALSKLKFKEEEIEPILQDFNKIVSYVDQIKELDTSSINEEEIYFNHENAIRIDKKGELLNLSEIEKLAPEYEDGHIVIPRVIET